MHRIIAWEKIALQTVGIPGERACRSKVLVIRYTGALPTPSTIDRVPLPRSVRRSGR